MADSLFFPADWRILVTGITSIHGWPIFRKLQTLLPQDRLFGIAPPRSPLPNPDNTAAVCMTDKEGLARVRDHFRPNRIVHCAGVCDLDLCEDRPQWAYAINVEGTRNILSLFGGTIPLFYMSTDLVFSGTHPPAGGYTEANAPDPVSVVGRTMAEAENEVQKHPLHCIVRLGLPLGESIYGDKGAIDWIEGRFKRNLPASLFYDEYRSCITCEDIGESITTLVAMDLKGLYHLGGAAPWSLHDIGRYVLRKGYRPELLKGLMRSEEVNGPPRVGDVTLNSAKLRRLLAHG